MARLDLLILITLVGAVVVDPLPAAQKNYPAARALATHLQPQGFPTKVDPAALGKARDQVIRILTVMEDSESSGGPGADELLTQAYKFREDVGPIHRAAAAVALNAAWREARALGLFDEKGKFGFKITKGADAGKECVFEHIVRESLAPEFSRDVANIRLVSPSRARPSSESASPRELATAQAFQNIAREAAGLKSVKAIESGPKTNSVGQTKEEALKIWKEHMERDGAKTLELPSIVLQGKLASSPANRNDYKWTVQADLQNLSDHATDIELECFIVGVTEKYRDRFLMAEVKQKVPLRSGQAEKIFIETPFNETIYKVRSDDYEQLTKKERVDSQASYRGTVFRVNHAKGVAATFATDPSLLELLERDENKKLRMDALPKLHADPKTLPKRPVSSP